MLLLLLLGQARAAANADRKLTLEAENVSSMRDGGIKATDASPKYEEGAILATVQRVLIKPEAAGQEHDTAQFADSADSTSTLVGVSGGDHITTNTTPTGCTRS